MTVMKVLLVEQPTNEKQSCDILDCLYKVFEVTVTKISVTIMTMTMMTKTMTTMT